LESQEGRLERKKQQVLPFDTEAREGESGGLIDIPEMKEKSQKQGSAIRDPGPKQRRR
jgi:hypothetical protein